MSYGQAVALQGALFGMLADDPALQARLGDAIYDAPPAGALPGLYVLIGPETVRDRSDVTGTGARHDVVISVVTTAPGFAAAKGVAARISDLLSGSAPALTRGRVTGLHFLKARAARTGTGETRRIDMTFRARLEDD